MWLRPLQVRDLLPQRDETERKQIKTIHGHPYNGEINRFRHTDKNIGAILNASSMTCSRLKTDNIPTASSTPPFTLLPRAIFTKVVIYFAYLSVKLCVTVQSNALIKLNCSKFKLFHLCIFIYLVIITKSLTY